MFVSRVVDMVCSCVWPLALPIKSATTNPCELATRIELSRRLQPIVTQPYRPDPAQLTVLWRYRRVIALVLLVIPARTVGSISRISNRPQR